jgi:hypothetical protein
MIRSSFAGVWGVEPPARFASFARSKEVKNLLFINFSLLLETSLPFFLSFFYIFGNERSWYRYLILDIESSSV